MHWRQFKYLIRRLPLWFPPHLPIWQSVLGTPRCSWWLLVGISIWNCVCVIVSVKRFGPSKKGSYWCPLVATRLKTFGGSSTHTRPERQVPEKIFGQKSSSEFDRWRRQAQIWCTNRLWCEHNTTVIVVPFLFPLGMTQTCCFSNSCNTSSSPGGDAHQPLSAQTHCFPPHRAAPPPSAQPQPRHPELHPAEPGPDLRSRKCHAHPADSRALQHRIESHLYATAAGAGLHQARIPRDHPAACDPDQCAAGKSQKHLEARLLHFAISCRLIVLPISGLNFFRKSKNKTKAAAFNQTLSVVQPLMSTPKGAALPQHSFFHTPVSLSPLAAMVTSSRQPATRTIYVPQRKLDVHPEDSWGALSVRRGHQHFSAFGGLLAVTAAWTVALNCKKRQNNMFGCSWTLSPSSRFPGIILESLWWMWRLHTVIYFLFSHFKKLNINIKSHHCLKNSGYFFLAQS